jgi:hypothetical protein
MGTETATLGCGGLCPSCLFNHSSGKEVMPILNQGWLLRLWASEKLLRCG